MNFSLSIRFKQNIKSRLPLGLLLFLCFGLFSCQNVQFASPQPGFKKDLKSFPKELLGKWSAESMGNFTIESQSIAMEKSGQTVFLSDSLKLRKFKGVYFINALPEDDKFWSLLIIKPVGTNNLLFQPFGDNEQVVKVLKKCCTLTTIENGKSKKSLLANPDKKQWKEILKSDLLTPKADVAVAVRIY